MRRMTANFLVRAGLLGVALVALASRAAHAQQAAVTERTSPHLRNDCRLAAQTLETGHPAPHSAWALETIARCEESAGAALAALWSAPPSDSAALEQLFAASAQVRDARLLDAVARVAESGGQATLVRVTALRALAAYVDPGVVAPVELLVEPDPREYRVASRDHAVQIDGSVPLGADTTASVRALLQRLTTDGDASVRAAATYLLRRLALD